MKALSEFRSRIEGQLELLGINKNQVAFLWEDGALEDGSNKEDENGFHFMDFKYRVVCDVEQLPINKLSLLALLSKEFVSKLDREELEPLRIEVDEHERGRCLDIEITFGVRDPVYLTEVENSPIQFIGKSWGFGDHVLDVAESGELID